MRNWLIGLALASGFLAAALYFARADSTLVQEAAGEVASGTSLTLNFASNVTPGDEVTVFAACAGHTNTLAVSGLSGAAWSLIEDNPMPADPNSPTADMWLAAAPAGAGSTITIAAGSADNCAGHAAEWAATTGVKDTGSAVDRNSGGFGTYGGAETANANDLVVMDVAWKGSATITGAPVGTTGPLRFYTAMAPANADSVLNVQPYYFLAWRTASYPAVNGSLSAGSDWTALQVALESAGANPTPTAAAPCAGPTPPAAVAPYTCARWGVSTW